MTDAVRRAEPAIREVFVYKYRLQYEVGEARVLVVMKARYLADNLELDAPKRAMPPNKALQPGRQACCACQDCQPWST